jgi:hypothetical protein
MGRQLAVCLVLLPVVVAQHVRRLSGMILGAGRHGTRWQHIAAAMMPGRHGGKGDQAGCFQGTVSRSLRCSLPARHTTTAMQAGSMLATWHESQGLARLIYEPEMTRPLRPSNRHMAVLGPPRGCSGSAVVLLAIATRCMRGEGRTAAEGDCGQAPGPLPHMPAGTLSLLTCKSLHPVCCVTTSTHEQLRLCLAVIVLCCYVD